MADSVFVEIVENAVGIINGLLEAPRWCYLQTRVFVLEEFLYLTNHCMLIAEVHACNDIE